MRYIRQVTRRVFAVLGVVATAVSLATVVTAEARGGDSAEVIEQFWQFSTANGVDAETASKLGGGLAVGDVPMSMQQDALPVRSESFETDAAHVTRSYFADGSVTVSTLEKPSELGAGAQRAASCTTDSWTGVTYYNNCLVTGDNGTVYLSFRTNYMVQHSGYDKITSSGWNASQSAVGATCGTPSLDSYVDWETYSAPARLGYRTHCTFLGIGSWNMFLYLYVQSNGRWTSFW